METLNWLPVPAIICLYILDLFGGGRFVCTSHLPSFICLAGSWLIFFVIKMGQNHVRWCYSAFGSSLCFVISGGGKGVASDTRRDGLLTKCLPRPRLLIDLVNNGRQMETGHPYYQLSYNIICISLGRVSGDGRGRKHMGQKIILMIQFRGSALNRFCILLNDHVMR